MKEKRNLLIGMILGVLISWALVSFSIPFIIKKYSFLLGFIGCLALMSLALILLLVWDKKSFLIDLFRTKSTTKDSGNVSRTYVLIRVLVFILIVMGALVSSYLISKQNELFQVQLQHQKKRIEHESELLESVRNSHLVYLMSNIFDKVDDELKDNPKRTLSTETIARIAALSYSFKPYRYLKEDGLSKQKLSPERGQLLLALVKMGIDSSSFDKIKYKSSFSGADLKGANLWKSNLRGVNLSGANLKDADLRGANLRGVNLKGANLWGANLGNAVLSGSDLRRANLKWAELRGAELKKVNFQGADLSSAILSETDLRGADLKWVFLNEAFLNGANLAEVALSGSALKRANLSDANLSEANLMWVNLTEAYLSRTNLTNADMSGAYMSGADLRGANLSGTVLYKATVKEENWFEKLTEWRVTGAKEIQRKYNIVVDEYGEANYRLFPIKNK